MGLGHRFRGSKDASPTGTDRIAAGEVPPAPRCCKDSSAFGSHRVGLGRSQVVPARRRSITAAIRMLNPNGLMYGLLGIELRLSPVLDPVHNTVSRVPLTVRDPNTQPATGPPPPAVGTGPTRFFGRVENNVHNPMYFDEKGRVWNSSTIRPPPSVLQGGLTHPSAKLFPVNGLARQLAMSRPQDENSRTPPPAPRHMSFWSPLRGRREPHAVDEPRWCAVVGWLDTKMFDETGDEEKSQGWTALILECEPGFSKRDEYMEPNQPRRSDKDGRIQAGLYSVAPAPDRSIWGLMLGFPGGIVRILSGAHPPETALSPSTTNRHITILKRRCESRGAGKISHCNGVRLDRCSPAATWPASDGRKCKGPLNGPTSTFSIAPKGGRCLRRAVAATQGRDRGCGAPRGELLHVG